MNNKTWLIALIATTIFGLTAPIAEGNGATILFLLAATLIIFRTPLTSKEREEQ